MTTWRYSQKECMTFFKHTHTHFPCKPHGHMLQTFSVLFLVRVACKRPWPCGSVWSREGVSLVFLAVWWQSTGPACTRLSSLYLKLLSPPPPQNLLDLLCLHQMVLPPLKRQRGNPTLSSPFFPRAGKTAWSREAVESSSARVVFLC